MAGEWESPETIQQIDVSTATGAYTNEIGKNNVASIRSKDASGEWIECVDSTGKVLSMVQAIYITEIYF